MLAERPHSKAILPLSPIPSFLVLAFCTNKQNLIIDATKIISSPELQKSSYDKVFSNAAMHWILRNEETRRDFFLGVRGALKPGGIFVFEMGGMGNVAEVCLSRSSIPKILLLTAIRCEQSSFWL